MFKTVLYSCIFLFALQACKNPNIIPEEVSDDPYIRARELNDSAIVLLGYSYEKHSGDALDIFDQSISLDSAYDKARLNKLAILIKQHRYEDALEEIKALENLRPWDPDLLVCKGLLQDLNGDNVNAVYSYEIALKKYDLWRVSGDSLLPDKEDLAVREASVWYLLKENEKGDALLLTVQDPELLENAKEMLPDRRKILNAFWKVMIPRG